MRMFLQRAVSPFAALFATLVVPTEAGAPVLLAYGANFLQAGAVHPASGDIFLLTDPSDKDHVPNKTQSPPVSVAVLPGGSPANASFASLTVIDNGTAIAAPTDVAFFHNVAFIVDQGNPGIVAFNRSTSGQWRFWTKWLLSDMLPSCDKHGRHFGQPESIAVGPAGEVYVTMAVMYGKRCLLHPLDRCCQKVSTSSVVMQLELPRGNGKEAVLREVLSTKSFFTLSDGTDLSFHVRAIDVVGDGDIVLTGYGDDGAYFGHTAWRWSKKTQQVVRIAGQASGPGGGIGDGGNATNATLNLPWGIVAIADSVYISEASNYDVRSVIGGIISTASGAPHGETFDNSYFRKLHRGTRPGTLLLAISGMGSDSGSLIEFEVNDGVVLV